LNSRFDPRFPCRSLWKERALCSVANLTRRDGEEFFRLIERAAVQSQTHAFTLEEANEALARLQQGRI
jgi:propanol-preferring alcohol dehydrogenase